MTATKQAPVTEIDVVRHETGCGYSMRVYFTVTFRFDDGTAPVVVKNRTSRHVLDYLRQFGADRDTASRMARYSGRVRREPGSTTVTADEKTRVNWEKCRERYGF